MTTNYYYYYDPKDLKFTQRAIWICFATCILGFVGGSIAEYHEQAVLREICMLFTVLGGVFTFLAVALKSKLTHGGKAEPKPADES
jgi:uncharacterized membrane protein YfcA